MQKGAPIIVIICLGSSVIYPLSLFLTCFNKCSHLAFLKYILSLAEIIMIGTKNEIRLKE